MKGKPFIIAKAGKPTVKVLPIDDAPEARKRLGFMQGAIIVPEDFDRMDQVEIESLFGLDE